MQTETYILCHRETNEPVAYVRTKRLHPKYDNYVKFCVAENHTEKLYEQVVTDCMYGEPFKEHFLKLYHRYTVSGAGKVLVRLTEGNIPRYIIDVSPENARFADAVRYNLFFSNLSNKTDEEVFDEIMKRPYTVYDLNKLERLE